MLKFNRTLIASVAVAAACMGGAAIGTTAVAAASGGTVTATGGDGTAVDTDGTQGDFAAAVQGKTDDDGDQDAFLTPATEATPQYSAAQK